jgi:acetone carboxylase gamma subunit
MIIHDYLEVDEENKVYRCASCKNVYCRLEENYKEYLAMREGTCQELAGPSFADKPAGSNLDNRLIFRHFYCPKCGGLVTTEVALEGDPVFPEILIRL